MEPEAETALVKVYWLSDVEAGYAVWTGTPRLESAKEALVAVGRVIRARKARRWITSTEDAKVPPPEARDLIMAWMTKLTETTLVAWADIAPRSAVAQLVVKDLGKESVMNGVTFAQFATLDAAKAWLATK